jgi:hypothetical protein
MEIEKTDIRFEDSVFGVFVCHLNVEMVPLNNQAAALEAMIVTGATKRENSGDFFIYSIADRIRSFPNVHA